MGITQADGYEAVFELPDGREATLPVVVWFTSPVTVTGLVNQVDLEDLLGARFNYGNADNDLVTPRKYSEFKRYRKAGCIFGELPQS